MSEEAPPISLKVLPPVASPLIPRLVDLCTETIINNFTECSKIHLLPKKYQVKILQKLPLDIDLSTAVMSIEDGNYWKRRTLTTFPGVPHDPAMKNWKQFYLEQYASKALEEVEDDHVDELFEKLRSIGPYIRSIRMKRCPSKISVQKLFRTLRGLRNLTLVYGEPRRNFACYEEFDEFNVQSEMSATQRDCLALQTDFEAIGSFCALEKFDMTDNCLTDKCAQIIGMGLIYLKNLRSLTFAHNEIGNLGFQHLCQCMRSAPIEYIDCSDNKIGADGAQGLANCCEKNTTLKYLNLSSNQLGDNGLLPISFIVEKTTSLEFLDISGNRIEHFAPLIEALSKNNTIKELVTAANMLSLEDAHAFEEVAMKSQVLDKLDIRADFAPTQINEEDYIIKTTETSEAPLLRIK